MFYFVNDFLSLLLCTYLNIECIAFESTNTVLYRRAKLLHKLILLIICKLLVKLIIYHNVLICVVMLTYIMLANLNVTNVYIFINTSHAKIILADCLISRAQKNRYRLFFHDFIKSIQNMFNWALIFIYIISLHIVIVDADNLRNIYELKDKKKIKKERERKIK